MRAQERRATMNMQAMVSLLRCIPETRREMLMGGLPSASAQVPDAALAALEKLPEAMAQHLLTSAGPVAPVGVLTQMEAEKHAAWLG